MLKRKWSVGVEWSCTYLLGVRRIPDFFVSPNSFANMRPSLLLHPFRQNFITEPSALRGFPSRKWMRMRKEAQMGPSLLT